MTWHTLRDLMACSLFSHKHNSARNVLANAWDSSIDRQPDAPARRALVAPEASESAAHFPAAIP